MENFFFFLVWCVSTLFWPVEFCSAHRSLLSWRILPLFPKFSSRSLINGFIIYRSVFDSSEMLFLFSGMTQMSNITHFPPDDYEVFFPKTFSFVFNYAYVCVLYECLYACSALRGQKRALGPLELEWQCAMSCLMCVLGTQLRPSEEQNL